MCPLIVYVNEVFSGWSNVQPAHQTIAEESSGNVNIRGLKFDINHKNDGVMTTLYIVRTRVMTSTCVLVAGTEWGQDRYSTRELCSSNMNRNVHYCSSSSSSTCCK